MPNITIPPQNRANPLGYALSHYAPEIGTASSGYVRAIYQSLNLPLRVAEYFRVAPSSSRGNI